MDEENVIEWPIRNLHNAYTERPPTEYIVDKYFAASSLNIVYGPPASMKSILLADLCAAVVAGMDWLPGCNGNHSGIPVKQSPVFWLDMDNGTRRTDQRIEAVSRSRNLTVDAPFHYVSMPMPPFNVADLDALIYLKTLIRHVGARMVVIDNLGLITGEVEENSAAMAMVMGYLRQIAEGTNCALLVIHHQRKGGANGGRAGDAVRGHSSIEAAVDLALHIGRERDSNKIYIRSTKTRDVDVPDVIANFYYEHRQGTSDLLKAWFDGSKVQRGENPVRDSILYLLESGEEMTKTRLVQAVYEDLNGAHTRSKIRAWVDDMTNVSGELAVKKGAYNAQIITIS